MTAYESRDTECWKIKIVELFWVVVAQNPNPVKTIIACLFNNSVWLCWFLDRSILYLASKTTKVRLLKI